MERLCAFYNIELQLSFIRGVDNTIAVMISRLQDGKMCPAFRAIFPQGNEEPQPQISPVLLFL